MRRPMLVLAFGVAIFDKHTRLTNLETDAPLLAALGATAGRHWDGGVSRSRFKLSV